MYIELNVRLMWSLNYWRGYWTVVWSLSYWHGSWTVVWSLNYWHGYWTVVWSLNYWRGYWTVVWSLNYWRGSWTVLWSLNYWRGYWTVVWSLNYWRGSWTVVWSLNYWRGYCPRGISDNSGTAILFPIQKSSLETSLPKNDTSLLNSLHVAAFNFTSWLFKRWSTLLRCSMCSENDSENTIISSNQGIHISSRSSLKPERLRLGVVDSACQWTLGGMLCLDRRH